MDRFNTTMMVKYIHLIIVLLQAYEGTIMILSASSSGVVSVCPGKQLCLVCTVNHSRVLKWAISLPKGNITSLRSIPYSGFIGPLNLTLNDAADTVVFHFTRTSEEWMLPLIVELLIDRVSTNLNETNVLCLPFNDSEPQITFRIHVLGENSFHPPEVEMDELTFQSANFTVTLSWAQEAQVSYNISIDPLTELVSVTNTTWKVTGNYNTLYNMSIEAILCDNYSKRTKIFLEYATCEFLTRESLGTSVTINSTEYRNPPVTGDNVTFLCLFGELIGPKRTTCQKNGDWEPDPSGTMCKPVPPSSICDPPTQPINGYIFTNTSNNTVIFVCQNQTQSYLETIFLATCNEHGVWEPDPRDHCIIFDSESNASNSHPPLSEAGKFAVASVSVFLVTFALAFTVGFVTGHCCRKKSSDSAETNAAPVYDTIQVNQVEHPKRDVSMSENIAYSTVKLTTVAAN